jgi:hypothetical protein
MNQLNKGVGKMRSPADKPSRWLAALAAVAILFGVATIISGGRTLFDAETQQAAGNYVAFVLWFNFLAGFAYVIAGVGLWLHQRWSLWFSLAIAVATFLVFAAFGIHIWRGGSYEMRTVGAMALRSVTWMLIFGVSYLKMVGSRTQVTAQR